MPRDLLAESKNRAPRNLLENRAPRNLLENNQISSSEPNIEEATIFGNPDAFSQKMEDFYRKSGIHGANKAFANTFGFGQHVKNANEAAHQAAKTHPSATKAGEVAANLYSSIPFFMGGSQIAQKIPKLGQVAKTIASAGIGGGAHGFAQSAQSMGERLLNTVGEGLLSALVPSAIAAVPLAGRGVKAVGKAATKTKVGKGIGQEINTLQTKFNNLYEGILNEANEEGLKTALKSPGQRALKGLQSSVAKPVKKALETNNVRDVHAAQSKLGQFIRKQERLRDKGGIIDDEALQKAIRLRSKFKGSLDKTLSKSSSGLSDRYKDVTSLYKQELVPYTRNPGVQEFLAGDITEKDFVKALQGGSKAGKLFRKDLAKKHPEVALNKTLGNVIKGIPIVGAGAYGVNKFFGD